MRLFALFLLALLVAGCFPRFQAPAGYYGPTKTLSEVVQGINANNRQIKTIWARHEFEALLYDNKGKSHALSGNGTLLFRKPDDLLLKAAGVVDFFEAGSNHDRYWFTVYPKEISTQWWGRREDFSEEAAREIPIRPDLLMEVLGIQEIDENLLRPPVPVLRFNNDARAYMLIFSTPLADRWVAVKEVWFDVDTLRPRLVLLFDRNGRIITRAYLSDYRKVEGAGGVMATRFDLFFPQNKSQLAFHITELRQSLQKGRITFPNDASFAFPEEPGVEKRIHIQ